MKIILFLLLFFLLYPLYAKDKKTYLGAFEIGYKYQYLEPDHIQNAYVKTVGLNIIRFKWNLKAVSWLDRWPLLKMFLPQFTYEWTPGDKATQERLLALSKGGGAGSERFIADFDLDIGDFFGKPKKHYLVASYDDQSFLYSVQAKQDFWFFYGQRAQLLIPGDNIDVATTFNNLRIGYLFKKKRYSLGLGWFDLAYKKPLTSDVLTTTEAIYESELQAQGMYFQAAYHLNYASINFLYSRALKANIELVQGISAAFQPSSQSVKNIEFDEYAVYFTLHAKQFGWKIPLQLNTGVIQRNFSNYNDDLIYNFSLVYQFRF